jgi:hypothetical protein
MARPFDSGKGFMRKPREYIRPDQMQCGHCWGIKGMDEFYRNKARATGFDHLCKDCRKTRSTEHFNATNKRRWVKAGIPPRWNLASYKWTRAAIEERGFPFRHQVEKPGDDEI